jgi:hypothetical protein
MRRTLALPVDLDRAVEPAVLEEVLLAIRGAATQPTVRRKLLSSVFDWLKKNSRDACFAPLHWSGVQSIVLLGLTDVWSAIRKLSASRLFSLAAKISPGQTFKLYDALCAIATPSAAPSSAAPDSWRSLEGALLGMRSVIKRFRSYSSASSPSVSGDVAAAFPDALVAKTRAVVFGQLSHPQLSVREASCRVLSALLTRSGDTEVKGMLAQAIARLQPSADGTLLGAFEAEGVLRFCVVLVASPTTTAAHLLAAWDEIRDAFRPYLRHDASTSRQMASLIAQHIVAKANGALDAACRTGLAQKVLTSLVAHEEESAVASAGESEGASSGGSSGALACWQWREGRLLAYELLVRYMLANLAICAAQRSALVASQQQQQQQASLAPVVTAHLTPRHGTAAALASPVPSPSPRAPTAWSPQVMLRQSTHTRTHVMRTPIAPAAVRLPSAAASSPSTPTSGFASPDARSIIDAGSVTGGQVEAKDALLDALAAVAPSGMAPAEMLWRMMEQTRECCAASQFELRRMGLQLVPLLTQALCCVSLGHLVRFWGGVGESVAANDRRALRAIALTMRAALCFVGGFDTTNPAFPATGVATADVVSMLGLRARLKRDALPTIANTVDRIGHLVLTVQSAGSGSGSRASAVERHEWRLDAALTVEVTLLLHIVGGADLGAERRAAQCRMALELLPVATTRIAGLELYAAILATDQCAATVRVLLFTVIFHANLAHSLTRSLPRSSPRTAWRAAAASGARADAAASASSAPARVHWKGSRSSRSRACATAAAAPRRTAQITSALSSDPSSRSGSAPPRPSPRPRTSRPRFSALFLTSSSGSPSPRRKGRRRAAASSSSPSATTPWTGCARSSRWRRTRPRAPPWTRAMPRRARSVPTRSPRFCRTRLPSKRRTSAHCSSSCSLLRTPRCSVRRFPSSSPASRRPCSNDDTRIGAVRPG